MSKRMLGIESTIRVANARPTQESARDKIAPAGPSTVPPGARLPCRTQASSKTCTSWLPANESLERPLLMRRPPVANVRQVKGDGAQLLSRRRSAREAVAGSLDVSTEQLADVDPVPAIGDLRV